VKGAWPEAVRQAAVPALVTHRGNLADNTVAHSSGSIPPNNHHAKTRVKQWPHPTHGNSSPVFVATLSAGNRIRQSSVSRKQNLVATKKSMLHGINWDSFRRPQEVFAAIMKLQKNSAKPYELDENVATEATPEFCLMMSKP
jgi:hypothetical protein